MDATLAHRLTELTQLAAAVLDAPLAAVTTVTDREVRVLAGTGVPSGLAVPVTEAICPTVLGGDAPVVVSDLRRVKRYADLPIVVRDGFQFYAGWPLAVDGRPEAVLCVLDRRPRRMTAAHRNALGMLARHAGIQLANAGGELVADRLRDDFVALVSHEVRTPLAAIQGYVELLLDGLPDGLGQHGRFAANIEANVGRLVRLIDQLLLTSTAAAGGLVLRWEQVDLHALADVALDDVRSLAESAGVTLARRDAGPVEKVHGDRALLVQATDGLLRNGIRFTPSGGRVDLLVGRDRMPIEVVDTGVGIPPTERDRVFDRFFRGEYARMHQVPGSGLGLSLVKAITEAHGGAVHLRSEPDVGTKVGLTLPNDALFGG